MSTGKWSGTEGRQRQSFISPDKVSNHGVDCPLIVGHRGTKCFGTLKKHPKRAGWAVCDDCRASFPPSLLRIFKIDTEKFK